MNASQGEPSAVPFEEPSDSTTPAPLAGDAAVAAPDPAAATEKPTVASPLTAETGEKPADAPPPAVAGAGSLSLDPNVSAPTPAPANPVPDTLPAKPSAGPLACPEPKTILAQALEDANPTFWKDVKAALATEPEPLLAEVERLATALADALEKPEPGLLLFDDCKAAPEQRFVCVPAGKAPARLWMVGDLHGDVLGLETILHYAATSQNGDKPAFLFIGDLFDRGKYGHLILYKVLSLFERERGKHAFIVGNHDEGLRQAADGSFASSVQPSELAEWLNKQAEDSPWRGLAAAAIKFFVHAHRAVLLPDGLLVAHGGVPHVDRQGTIHTLADLSEKPLLEDFVWTRLHDTAKKKIPNRNTRGCSLGIDDFNAFCLAAEKVLGRPIRGMVRGHDHLEARYAFFEKYRDRPVLTINAMCYRQEGEMFGEFARPAIYAEWTPDKMPTVCRIEVPTELLADTYLQKGQA